MNIYLASSRRNTHFDSMLRTLRGFGFEVYNFKDANAAFAWESCGVGSSMQWDPSTRRQALRSEEACDAFANDRNAIEDCDALVMVMPCGRSAHLELGYAAGIGRPVFVYDPAGNEEPELMIKFAEIFSTPVELIDALNDLKRVCELEAKEVRGLSRIAPTMSNHELRKLEGAL